MQQPRVLIVTGGSRGIGAAVALLAATEGWAVAVNYHTHSLAADEVVRRIRGNGGRAMAVQADVACEEDVLRMFQQVDAKLGPLSGLVNNAGVVDVAARVDERSVARLERQREQVSPKAEAGNLDAHRVLLGIAKRKAALLGLDAPTRLSVRGGDAVPGASVPRSQLIEMLTTFDHPPGAN